MRICNYCGSENQDNATVCRNCGGNLNVNQGQNSGYQQVPVAPVNPLSLPEQYRPLSAWAYFGYGLLFSVPIVGFILLIVFSFSSSNINRRNYARSYFCGLLIMIIIVVVALIISLISGVSIFSYFESLR